MELETKVNQKFWTSPFVIRCNRLHPCMFVCFTLFVSFWCSPIMSNIIYCCLCDIYLAKSKKRPRHRCVTPTKTSVKQFARGVSLFWLVFLSLFCFVCSSVVCRHCMPYYQQYLYSLPSSVYNLELDILVVQWCTICVNCFSNNWPDSFKNHPEISHRATDNTATNDLPGNISARFTGGLLVSKVS